MKYVFLLAIIIAPFTTIFDSLFRLDIILNNINIDNFLFSKFFGYRTSTAVSNKLPESSMVSFLINRGTNVNN